MATVRKHRSNWVADYRDQFGKRHRERPDGQFENMTLQRRAAQALLKKRLDEVDRGSFGPQTHRLTFAKVADQYLTSKVNIRPSTRRSYGGLIELYLKPYFGDWKIHQISATDIERYRSALRDGLPAPIEMRSSGALWKHVLHFPKQEQGNVSPGKSRVFGRLTRRLRCW